MNSELKLALEALEREKDIKKETMLEAIAKSLISAFDKQYKSSSNVHVDIDYDNFEFHVIASKEVVPTEDDVMDPAIEVSMDEAKTVNQMHSSVILLILKLSLMSLVVWLLRLQETM